MTFGKADNTPKDLEDAPVYSRNLSKQNGRQVDVLPENTIMDPAYAKKLGREIYESSTSWLNASRRSSWSDSLKAFQGKHPSGSKYNSGDYSYRSRLFRPKTRAMVRKGEASTAAAFFSNEDVVAISAQDDNSIEQQASAEIMQEILQYQLTRNIPWFLTLTGARQDAEVSGICIAKAYWKFTEKFSHIEARPVLDPLTGMPVLNDMGELATEEIEISRKIDDKPVIDLIAPENFRFDPGADWRNPIGTSPYTIELIPMYVADVQERIADGDWLPVAASALENATSNDDDTTRSSREAGRIPGKDDTAQTARPYNICWVRETIVRERGEEVHFYSLNGTGELLSKPRPLSEVYLHGMRPYVCGFIIPETHKTYPSSRVELIRDLQTKANDVENLRLDNVKLVLNPRQFMSAGYGLDPNELRRFVPGKVNITNGKVNIQEVITWDRPPEVTGSAYAEQDRVDMDFDELIGGLSHATINANKGVFDAQGNTALLDSNAGRLEEYDLRVFTETFVEPLLRHLVKLEQAYETDAVVLTMAGQKANLFQRFGINEITDELLKQDLTIKVNVGMGATNPKQKLNNFATAVQILGNIYSNPMAAAAMDFEEVTKEVFGQSGYKDGMRFFKEDFDPMQAMQMMAGGGKKEDGKEKMQMEALKIKGEAARQREQDQLDMQKGRQQHAYKMQELGVQAKMQRDENMFKLWMTQQQDMKRAQQEAKRQPKEEPIRLDTSNIEKAIAHLTERQGGASEALKEMSKLQIVMAQQMQAMRRDTRERLTT